MKDLLSLKKGTQITTLRVVLFDVAPIFLLAGFILLIDIGIITLIGSSSNNGGAYSNGIHGVQSFPIIHVIIALGAAIIITRSLGVVTWIAWLVGILLFTQTHHDSFISGLLYGSIIPQLVGIIVTLFVARAYEAIQLYRLPGKIISISAIIIYALLVIILIGLSTIHRQ